MTTAGCDGVCILGEVENTQRNGHKKKIQRVMKAMQRIKIYCFDQEYLRAGHM